MDAEQRTRMWAHSVKKNGRKLALSTYLQFLLAFTNHMCQLVYFPQYLCRICPPHMGQWGPKITAKFNLSLKSLVVLEKYTAHLWREAVWRAGLTCVVHYPPLLWFCLALAEQTMHLVLVVCSSCLTIFLKAVDQLCKARTPLDMLFPVDFFLVELW